MLIYSVTIHSSLNSYSFSKSIPMSALYSNCFSYSPQTLKF
uniref:Uncharacterized protein n=1 Tax=Rhizophora mucronata TaxID=61149 RepID=A0A2P2QAC1_RHIMU